MYEGKGKEELRSRRTEGKKESRGERKGEVVSIPSHPTAHRQPVYRVALVVLYLSSSVEQTQASEFTLSPHRSLGQR